MLLISASAAQVTHKHFEELGETAGSYTQWLIVDVTVTVMVMVMVMVMVIAIATVIVIVLALVIE